MDGPLDAEVLVTGSTGYIARHVVVQLLDAGYTVRGTARSAGALDTLRADLGPFVADGGSLDRFSVVAADLTRDDGWDDAVRGCTYVHHVASPLPGAPPKHEDEVIVPARDGTLRVLRAALAGGVQRVVTTSSLAAVLYGGDRKGVRSRRPTGRISTAGGSVRTTSRRPSPSARHATSSGTRPQAEWSW
jgi:dihydroflavonol-4-reductase